MTLDLWLAFVLATLVLLVIPGPTVLLVVGYALSHGRRSAFGTVPGVALGDLTAITLSMAGLGALLATSAALFTGVKWAGAAYLVYLGVRMWRAEPDAGPVPSSMSGRRVASRLSMFRQAWAVTTLNPKSILFFVAFLPQFITPAAPAVPQMATLGATFVSLATLNAALYALLAGTIRSALRQPRIQKTVNRVGGSVLIGAGVAAAGLK